MTVDPNIKRKADDIRNKIYGRDVRESLASGLEDMSVDVVDTVNRQDNVESQFQDVIENTTDKDVISAPEIIAARNGEANLKARMDKDRQEVTAQLAQINQKTEQNNILLKVGRVELPKDFPTIPFLIYKKSEGVYTHNFDVKHINDWSGAIEVFISYAGSGDGTDRDIPIAFQQFILRYKEGAYGSHTKFILTFVENHYSRLYDITDKLNDINIDILFRSGSPSGRTTIGNVRTSSSTEEDWSLISDNVYKTVMTTDVVSVDYPVNIEQKDPFGLPIPYAQVNSLEACEQTVGSYYLTGRTIYLHKNPYEHIKSEKVARRLNMLPVEINANTVAFENLDFLADTAYFHGNSIDSGFYFSGCTFYRGMNDAFAITGAYKVYLLDCVSAWGSKDGFNYHTNDKNSIAVEVNCLSYGNGKYKFNGGNQGRGSNNGSTAHDGMYMLRTGCVYSECEGPVVADINNCYSITIGCEVYYILNTTTGVRAGYYVHNDVGTLPENEKPKIMVECKQSGVNFDRLIQSTNVNKLYYQNMKGHDVIVGNAELINYESFILS